MGVHVSITTEGTIEQPTIVRGSVGDAQGDACLLARLRDARPQGDPPAEDLRLDVGLAFFYAPPVQMNEAYGRVPAPFDHPPEDPAAEPH